MKKQSDSIKVTGMILGGVLLLTLIGVLVYLQTNPSQTVNVSGTSEVDVMPDLMTFYLGVETTSDSSAEANSENEEIVDDVITELVKLGFERDEITTESFNIYPEYDWSDGDREFIGYTATHRLKVELSEDEFDMAGDVIDVSVDAGALVSYINFELSLEKQKEYKMQVLEEATADARAKAEGIATGLGRNLGRVVSVSSTDFGYSPWNLYSRSYDEGEMGGSDGAQEAKTAVSSVSIQPGEQTVTGYVSVVYALR